MIREPGAGQRANAMWNRKERAEELNPCHPDVNWYGRGAHHANGPKALLVIRRSARRNKEG